jgi:type IV fimbrial biogenesis protein FimT
MKNGGSLSLRLSGFTLLEVMCVLVCVALALAITEPGWHAWWLERKAHMAAHSLHRALELARSEALRRRAEVRVIPLAQEPGVSNVRWEGGWQVFAPAPVALAAPVSGAQLAEPVEPNDDTADSRDVPDASSLAAATPASGQMLQVTPAFEGIVSGQSSRATAIVFDATGRLIASGLQGSAATAGVGAGAQWGAGNRSIWFEAPQGARRYCLVLSLVGRVRRAQVERHASCT